MTVFRLSIILSVIMSVFLIVPLSSSQESKPKHAPNALPGVEQEMLSPEYWISLHNDAEKIIMTPLEIERFNAKIRSKNVVFVDYYGKPDPLENWFTIFQKQGLLMNPVLPLDLPSTLQGDSLRDERL